MFALRERGLLEEGPWPFHLPGLRVRGFGPGGNLVSGHAQTASPLVSGDVVCGEPEERVSALGLQKALGLGSYHTAWEWSHKLRGAMVRPGRDRLSGIVEVDETFLGGRRRSGSGHGAEGKSLIFIAAEEAKDSENAIGRIRLSVIENSAGETLAKAVLAAVEPGSLIRTDGARGYSFLDGYGYIHVPSFHKDGAQGDPAPLAHRVASLLKRWWLGTHQGAISPNHPAYYLDEFTFRFNRRTSRSRGKLFYRLAEGALQSEPVPAKTLTHNI